MAERRHRVKRVHGLLRLAIEGGGLDVCSQHPTVVLDRGPGRGRLATLAAGSSGPWGMATGWASGLRSP